jgi:hypothetical protein
MQVVEVDIFTQVVEGLEQEVLAVEVLAEVMVLQILVVAVEEIIRVLRESKAEVVLLLLDG